MTSLIKPLISPESAQFEYFELSGSESHNDDNNDGSPHNENRTSFFPSRTPHAHAHSHSGKSSFMTSFFNLANNVAGVGLLTLTAAKAHSETGWIPAIAICCALAYASARTFVLIGKACEMTGEQTFKGLWGKAFSPSSAYIVDCIVFIQCFLGCTIYIGLLGDIFSTLLQNAGFFPKFLVSRGVIIVLATFGALFPLSLIRNLSALAFTSILGFCSVMYTIFFMLIRAMDGTYTAPNGKFITNDSDKMIAQPSFDNSSFMRLDHHALILISNLGLAFIAHYNAPTYYREMENVTTSSFQKMVYTAYAVLALIYVIAMCAGYATFGDSAVGNVLLNYHHEDNLAFFGRLATGLSVIFGFPLVSNGALEGLKNASMALGYPKLSIPENHPKVAACMLAIGSVIAIKVSDIKLIAGLSGAAMGSFLVYICPPLVYSAIVKKDFGEHSIEYKNAKSVLWNVPFGLIIAIMGVFMTLSSSGS